MRMFFSFSGSRSFYCHHNEKAACLVRKERPPPWPGEEGAHGASTTVTEGTTLSENVFTSTRGRLSPMKRLDSASTSAIVSIRGCHSSHILREKFYMCESDTLDGLASPFRRQV